MTTDVDFRALLVILCGLACAVILAAVLGGCSVPSEVGEAVREHTGHCELSYVEVTVPEGMALEANEATGVTSVEVDSGCFARYNSRACAEGGETVRLWSKGEEYFGYELVEGGACAE